MNNKNKIMSDIKHIEKTLEKTEALFVDNEHDSLDWKKIINWSKIVLLGGIWWWSLFTKGLGVTVVWTVVFIAVYALWYIMKDNRV